MEERRKFFELKDAKVKRWLKWFLAGVSTDKNRTALQHVNFIQAEKKAVVTDGFIIYVWDYSKKIANEFNHNSSQDNFNRFELLKLFAEMDGLWHLRISGDFLVMDAVEGNLNYPNYKNLKNGRLAYREVDYKNHDLEMVMVGVSPDRMRPLLSCPAKVSRLFIGSIIELQFADDEFGNGHVLLMPMHINGYPQSCIVPLDENWKEISGWQTGSWMTKKPEVKDAAAD